MTSYEDKKAQVNARNREKQDQVQDIGEIPAVVDWERRESCERDLVRFLKTYMPESFPSPFSQKHLEAIARLEGAQTKGGGCCRFSPVASASRPYAWGRGVGDLVWAPILRSHHHGQ